MAHLLLTTLPVLYLAAASTVAVSAGAPDQRSAEPTRVVVFAAGQLGYACYRIPAIETAPDGSLLAFAEARRYNGGDPGMEGNEIDLVMKRSVDNGVTWSEQRLIEHAGERWSAANPATLVDRKNHRMWLIYLRSKPGRDTDSSRPGTDDTQTLARHSDDNGLTWSEPMDLTAAVRDMADPRWTCTVVGPGGAIQTRSGRLLLAAWKAKPYVDLCIYSDDHGRTWHRGEPVPGAEGGDECSVVELSDGTILMDSRQERGPHRWLSVSRDGGRTWSAPAPGLTATPVCCAIKRYTRKSRHEDRDRLIWTGPKGPGRNALVARISYDEGRTFPIERLVDPGPSSYSDISLLKDGRVGVLYETVGSCEITFTALSREFIEPH
jgi:sialidase-1